MNQVCLFCIGAEKAGSGGCELQFTGFAQISDRDVRAVRGEDGAVGADAVADVFIKGGGVRSGADAEFLKAGAAGAVLGIGNHHAAEAKADIKIMDVDFTQAGGVAVVVGGAPSRSADQHMIMPEAVQAAVDAFVQIVGRVDPLDAGVDLCF